jgi:hypothetical protein
MSRDLVTTCDAPGCTSTIRGDLPPAWYRLNAEVAHGPFPTIADPRNEVLNGSRTFYACCLEHVRLAFQHALAVGHDTHRGIL